jgi:hypothetical protein
VRVFEIAAAALLGLLGVRSCVYWIRRPLASRSVKHQVLYSLWVTGRVGLWFAVAGVFVISASIHREGRAFTDEFHRYRWYFYVPLALAVVQLVAALLLSRSRSEEP